MPPMSDPTRMAEPPSSTPTLTGAGLHWRRIGLRVAEPLSVAAFFIYLLEKTWLRWPDPLIDFPRELYMAWRMSEGDLLYEKIANFYGPLPQLVQGAGFKIFGAGLDTMAWMNIALTVGVLLLLRGIFGTLGNRLMVWLASVVFLGVFAFCQYNTRATNFSYIAPYVAQTTYGFTGLLLVIWGLVRHLRSERPIWLMVAGFGAGVAYLDKPEPVLAAGGALGIYLVAQSIGRARTAAGAALTDGRGAGNWAARAVGWLAAGFFALCLPVFIFFWTQGGFAYALRATNWVLRSVLDPATRQVMANSSFMKAVIGFDHPWKNFAVQAEDGLGLVLVCGVIIVSIRKWTTLKKFSSQWWIALLIAITAAEAGEWLGWWADGWGGIGHAFVFPVCLAAAFYGIWSLWLAWRGGVEFSRVLGLAVLGVPASLMLARMILNGHIDAYGFVMMPLAMLFWIHLLVVEAAPGRARGGWLRPAIFTVLTLSATFSLLNFNLLLYSLKTYPVGEGRDHFYTFPPDINPEGLLLNVMIASVKKDTPNARTLVAFPHGIAVNYHCRVPSSVAEMEFNPVALGFVGPQHVVDELSAHPPDAVIVFHADYYVFGLQYFGQDEGSGSGIIHWLNDKYKVIARGGACDDSASGHKVDLLVPKATPGPPGAPLLPGAK
jgi:hypothetical protein